MSDPKQHFGALDGWRGISILLVLCAHLLPLGPKSLHLNFASGAMGMALFFTLSGFLITTFLLNGPSVIDFLFRRFFRIIPLAWLYMLITLPIMNATSDVWLAHFLFYTNWPPMLVTSMTSHLWSLCVEMQFYFSVACVYAIFGKRGLMVIPLLCIAFTAYRVANGVHAAVNTLHRIDEILAGGILALAYSQNLGQQIQRFIRSMNPFVLLCLLAISSHENSGFVNYLRPYFAALLVGWTLFNSDSRLSSWLNTRILGYIAAISFALYVIHPIFLYTWLGSGDTWVKYLKRPLYFAVVFGLAHVSTYYFEHRCIAFGKSLSARVRGAMKPGA